MMWFEYVPPNSSAGYFLLKVVVLRLELTWDSVLRALSLWIDPRCWHWWVFESDLGSFPLPYPSVSHCGLTHQHGLSQGQLLDLGLPSLQNDEKWWIYLINLASPPIMVWQYKTLIRFKWKVWCSACYNRFFKILKINITIASQGSSASSVCVHTHPCCDDQVSEWCKHLAEIFSTSACPASWHHNMMSSAQFMLKNNVIELPKGERGSQINLAMLLSKPCIEPHSKLFWDS